MINADTVGCLNRTNNQIVSLIAGFFAAEDATNFQIVLAFRDQSLIKCTELQPLVISSAEMTISTNTTVHVLFDYYQTT